MWKKNISGTKKTLHADGGTFSKNRYNLSFPKNFILNDLVLSLNSIGVSDTSVDLEAIGHGIDITLWDGINTFVTEFQKNFILKYNLVNLDTSRYNPKSISMYSSIDGIDWKKESTTIDWNKLEATMQANHLTKFALLGEKFDSIVPVTTAILSGTEISPDIFSSPVSMSLSSIDEPQEHSLGIEYTLYKIDDGEWTLYQEPVLFIEYKSYKVKYYSIDRDGNTEEIKTIEFSITQPENPELEIYFDFDNKEFTVVPNPVSTPFSSKIIKKKKKEFTVFTVSSGTNSTSITTQTKLHQKKYSLQIKSLIYNDNIINIEKEKLSVEYIKGNNKKSGAIKQEFNISDTIKIVLVYSEKDNNTKITIQEKGVEKRKEVFEGFKKIKIFTNQGSLDYRVE